MTRLIPWALPTIPGDSEGGYTPQPTPGPVRVDPYNFENVLMTYNNNPNQIYVQAWTITGTTLSGIEPVDTVGVSSIQLYVYDADEQYVCCSVDPVTFTLDTTPVSYSPNPLPAVITLTIATYRCVVYNSAGEIMQDYEKVVE